MRELPRVGHRGVHNRLDPDYAPTVEVFDNLTHEQIHTGVALLDPSVLQSGSQVWRTAAGGLNDAVVQAHTEISGAIADGWRGGAAGLAEAAVHDFEAAGRRLADVLTTVGQRLTQAGDAAETLRAGIPQPSVTEPDLAAALLDPHAATGNITVQRAAEDERADAVRVMESVYIGAFVPTGSEVPAFPDLPAPDSRTPEAPNAAPVPAATAPGSETPGRPVYPASAMSTVPEPPRPYPGVEPPAGTETEEPRGVTGPAPTVAAASAPVAEQQVTAADRTGPAQSMPTAPASASAPVAPAGTGAPATPAGMPGAPVVATPVRPAAIGKDEERPRDEQQRHAGGDAAVAGMGAGAIGGMMGGAMAADTVRSGSPVTSPRTDSTESEDDDLHFDDEDPTFLEPADAGGPLIGALDPTTPPVLGEWTEAE